MVFVADPYLGFLLASKTVPHDQYPHVSGVGVLALAYGLPWGGACREPSGQTSNGRALSFILGST